MANNDYFNRDIMFSDASGNKIIYDDSFDFFKNWNEYSISIDTEKGPLCLKWNNLQSLAANWFMQTGSWLNNPNLQTFFEFFPMWVKWNWWQNYQRNVYSIPDNSKVIDIGSGNSVLDLLLHQYTPGSEFYLIDRNNFITKLKNPQYPTIKNPCWQHSWSIVEDAIHASKLDRNKFHFLDVEDDWPVEVDMITSYMAWCMHFPKELYWNKVLQSLKKGGRLLVDVNILWESELIEEISDELGCRHTVIMSVPTKPIVNPYRESSNVLRDDLHISAYRCSWTRNR